MNNPKLLPSEKIAIEFILSDYPKKNDFDTILEKVSEDHKDILIWEPFERMETSEVADYIEDLDSQINDAINEAVEGATKDLLAALQEARDYLNALLDVGDDAAVDLLVNSGEDVEARLSAAIAKATQQP
jgi:vacuolar-type H+-ATPase subunit H